MSAGHDRVALQARLDTARERHLLPGAALAVVDGDQITVVASGVTNIDTQVEITHRKFDECAITWNQIDMSVPIDWYEHFDWRPDPHAALRNARGRRLRAVRKIGRAPGQLVHVGPLAELRHDLRRAP